MRKILIILLLALGITFIVLSQTMSSEPDPKSLDIVTHPKEEPSPPDERTEVSATEEKPISEAVNTVEQQVTEENGTAEIDLTTPVISIEELPYSLDFTLGVDDWHVASMIFVNNGDYTVQEYVLECLNKSSNDKNYFSAYDTVLPNETSPKVNLHVQDPQFLESLQPLILRYNVLVEEKIYAIKYDFKTDEYQIILHTLPEDVPSPVKVDQIPYSVQITPTTEFELPWALLTYTNESDAEISNYNLVMHLLDSNEKSYFSLSDTVLPGETSSNLRSTAPESGLLEDMLPLEINYRVKTKDGDTYQVMYDYKLQKYRSYPVN